MAVLHRKSSVRNSGFIRMQSWILIEHSTCTPGGVSQQGYSFLSQQLDCILVLYCLFRTQLERLSGNGLCGFFVSGLQGRIQY